MRGIGGTAGPVQDVSLQQLQQAQGRRRGQYNSGNPLFLPNRGRPCNRRAGRQVDGQALQRQHTRHTVRQEGFQAMAQNGRRNKMGTQGCIAYRQVVPTMGYYILHSWIHPARFLSPKKQAATLVWGVRNNPGGMQNRGHRRALASVTTADPNLPRGYAVIAIPGSYRGKL